MKYGRGAKKSQRRAWVFGMIERTTKRLFLYVCPRDGAGKYKRTRRALIPMILANVEPGSVDPKMFDLRIAPFENCSI